MNCQEFWGRMPELSNQLLGDESEHLETCRECAAAWERHRSLGVGMRGLSQDWKRVEAPSRVEAGLRAAFRTHRAMRPAEMPPRMVWMPLFAGLAAALLMALGLLLMRDRPAGTPRHASTATVQLAASTPAGFMDDTAPDSDGFIPLPNAESLAPDENVNVVRVEVPRSAMLAVGLPVSADQSMELVEADIKMGSDGLARAVRFVNE
ncbi:MAG: hypothetical protein P4L56_26740 [Candidatus Sulfopaludibacter sp.]|nr:hypothetical protein [Candidatus Sulfopaludibacter sp.]